MNENKIQRCKCGNWIYKDGTCAICTIIEADNKRLGRKENDSNTDAS